jgi:hypothetical protein
MNIYEAAEFMQVEIIITRFHNQDGRFSACFDLAEVKKGAMLSSQSGNGKTPIEAINEYSKIISCQDVVVDAMGENRREFHIPELELVR